MLKANRDESTVVDIALAQKDAEVKLGLVMSKHGTILYCLFVTKSHENNAAKQVPPDYPFNVNLFKRTV